MKVRWLNWFGVCLLCAMGFLALLPRAKGGAAPAPPMPALVSPVAIFRTLLATNETGRQAALAAKNPQVQKALGSKLAEYLALPPELRELRLTLTELRWYLEPMLRVSPAKRQMYLTQVPERLRTPALERLKHWDTLSPETRQKILQNEEALSMLIRLDRPAPPLPPMPKAPEPMDSRQQVDRAVQAWQRLPADTRRTLTARFDHFFDLAAREQAKTLQQLSEPERRVAEQLIAALGRLPKVEREQCLASFEKFAALSSAERRQFLDNAARWEALSPQQRRSIRATTGLMPPMPPGLLVGPPLAAAARTTNAAVSLGN